MLFCRSRGGSTRSCTLSCLSTAAKTFQTLLCGPSAKTAMYSICSTNSVSITFLSPALQKHWLSTEVLILYRSASLQTYGFSGVTVRYLCAESPSVAAALDCFSEARGLDRSLEIAADLTNIGEGLRKDSSESSDGAAPGPTAAADAYGQYLRSIGQRGAESEDIRDRNQACLKYALAPLLHCSTRR